MRALHTSVILEGVRRREGELTGTRLDARALLLAVVGAASACGADAVDDSAPPTTTGVTEDGGGGATDVEASTPATDAESSPVEAGADAEPIDAGDPGTHTDGLLNAGETDVDCGGATGALPCDLGKRCAAHADCASSVCRYDGRCIAAEKRSCAGHAGGDTCGPDGASDCCASIPVPRPGAPYTLDTYSITAGRFRQFVERTNGNLRGFIQANRPAWWEPLWDAWLPVELDDGTFGGLGGVYQQLGPGLYYDATGGNMGCQVDAYGARTYWIPDAVNVARFGDHQYYDQATLDAKPLVCATFYMVAAFCAWDGGRLPTLEELDWAWTAGDPANHYFPWGNTPRPLGWAEQFASDPSGQGFGTPYCDPRGTGPCALDVASWRYNSWTPPQMVATDYSVYIPPPGRYPKGNGPFGHADLGGLVFNVGGDLLGNAGDDPQERLAPLSRGGSWQGHEVPYYDLGLKLGWRSTSKYWATGGRCAR